MKRAMEIIEQLKATRSKLEKEKIIRENASNTNFTKVLEYTYNTYKVYSIGRKTIRRVYRFDGLSTPPPPTAKFDTIFELLDYLARTNRSDEMENNMFHFLNKFEEEERLLYMHIILKDLKCEINVTTINKALGDDFIENFGCMLAKSYKDHKHKVIGEDFIITNKLDGLRVLGIKENNKVKFMTRQGKEITDLVELQKDFRCVPNGVVLDGELLAINKDNLASKDLYQLTKKIATTDGKKYNLEMHVFDIIQLDDFKKGISSLGCIARKRLLHSLLEENKAKLSRVKEVPILYYGHNIDMVDKLLKEAIDNKQEGVMVNLADAKYVCKRTDSLLKVKVFNTVDLRVVNMLEGEGKYEGKLGSLVVDYKGYRVGVGTGLSDEDRGWMWSDKDKVIGKIVEISYFEETTNEQGGLSLRFPVYKNLRDDKEEPSYN